MTTGRPEFESPWKFFGEIDAVQLYQTCMRSRLVISFWTPWFGPPDLTKLTSTPTAGVLASQDQDAFDGVMSGSFLPALSNSMHISISDRARPPSETFE